MDVINAFLISGPSSFDTFTLFEKLPLELRLTIWEMACTNPRVVETTFYYQDDTLCWRLFPSEKSPVALFICKESRAHFLKQYQAYAQEGVGNPKIQYLDLSIDTIIYTGILGEDLISSHGEPVDPISLLSTRIPTLDKLAIYQWYHPSFSVPSLAVFRSLKEIIIFPPNGRKEIEKVDSLELYTAYDSNKPNERGFWEVRAMGFLEVLAELEMLVVGYEAPILRAGVLVVKAGN